MAPTSTATDNALAEARWNLDPLVDGARLRGHARAARRGAPSAPRRSPRRTGARSRSSTPTASSRRCASSSGSTSRWGAPAATPRSGSRSTRAIPSAARCCSGSASAARGSRRRSCSSSSSGTCSTTSAPRSCSPPTSSTSAATTCARRAAIARISSREPEERVLTEAEVTGRSAFQRLFTEQTSALMVELPDADEPMPLMEALSRLQDPDREPARRGSRRGYGRARARPAHPRVHLQHAAPGQVDQGPPALLRALARVAQPRERGVGRVGRGADRGRRAEATSWRGAGTG